MFQYLSLPGLGVYVGVDFCSEDTFVAEHFLDYAEVGAVFYQMGGEGVAEGVWGDVFVNAGKHGAVFHHVKDGNAAKGFAEAVQEGVVLVTWSRDGAYLEPGGESVQRRLPDGDEPFLVSFTHNPQEALVKIYMRNQQPAGLRHPQSAAIKDLQNSLVPNAGIRIQRHRVQYGIYLLYRKNGRKIPAKLWSVYLVTGVIFTLSLKDEIVEIGPQGTERMSLATLANTLRTL